MTSMVWPAVTDERVETQVVDAALVQDASDTNAPPPGAVGLGISDHDPPPEKSRVMLAGTCRESILHGPGCVASTGTAIVACADPMVENRVLNPTVSSAELLQAIPHCGSRTS